MPGNFEHKSSGEEHGKKLRKISDAEFEEYFGAAPDEELLREKEGGDKKNAGRKSPAKEKAVEPALDLEKVVITAHALERFEERLKKLDPKQKPSDPRGLILKLLGRAQEEGAIGGGMKVKRLMAHGYEGARYFHSEGWRFVIVEREGKFVIKTIERKKT